MLGTNSKELAPIRFRTFFISWNLPRSANDRVLAISAPSFLSLCQTVGVPVSFVEGLLEPAYWVRPGNGLFLHQDAAGQPSRFDLFYRYSFGLRTGRSYIFTTYDFNKKLTTNVCVNFVSKAMPFVEKLGLEVAKSNIAQPLALHTLLGSHAMDCWNECASFPRRTLLNDEKGVGENNPKVATKTLHRLSHDFHMLLADVDGFEEQLLFLGEASETFRKIHNKQTGLAGWSSEAAQIADRTNIRINLAFHLSTQVDNELNLQISKATTALARDAQRDSASMITIAAVTMFFLPGTFVSAVFSMTFFNFQQDPVTGQQQFQVSKRWWYFLAATIPLTILVFAVWIIWQKLRYKRFAMEDLLAQRKPSGFVGSRQELEMAN